MSPRRPASPRSCRAARPIFPADPSVTTGCPPTLKASRPMSAPLPKPDPTKGLPIRRLANGVRVVCDPMPGLQTVALSVVAGHGARLEDEARSGWSHLLEHMVFKGAGARSARDIVEVIEA